MSLHSVKQGWILSVGRMSRLGGAVKMMLKSHWRPQDVGDAKNVQNFPRKSVGSPDRPCVLQMAEMKGQGCPNLLALKRCHQKPWVLSLQLQSLVFVLLDPVFLTIPDSSL